VVRLAGYKDESLTVGLDENSASAIDLKRIEAPAAIPAKPPTALPQIRKKPAVPTARKASHSEEDEWRVH
jgi:hypothetical protein